jgi:hypothetical protein
VVVAILVAAASVTVAVAAMSVVIKDDRRQWPIALLP